MSGTEYDVTANYGLKKPHPDADDDQWGLHLNQNADLIDNLIKTQSDTLGSYVPLAGATMTGALLLSGDPTVDPQAATKHYVDNKVPPGGPFLPLSGGTLTGNLTGPSFNATGDSGYSQFGSRLLSATNLTNGATFVGINAGAAAFTAGGAMWLTAVGWGAAQLAGALENTAVGAKAMAALLPGGSANTAIGVGALMQDGTATTCTSIGNDNMRNTEAAQGCVSVGYYSLASGSPKNCVAIGGVALRGNSLSVIVGGAATAGDVLQLTFTGSFTGSPRTVSYTVGAGNSTTVMCNGLVSAINTDAVLLAVPGRFLAVANSPANNCLGISFDGTATLGLAIGCTANVTGAATETLTIGNGNLSDTNTAIGYNAMSGMSLTTAANNVAIGGGSLMGLSSGAGNIAIGRSAAKGLSSGSNNVAIGDLAFVAATTGVQNVFIGQNVGTAADTSFGNVAIGASAGLAGNANGFKNNVLIGINAGRGMTTGGGNTILGAMLTASSQNQITTGTNNIAIGQSAAVASATAGNQMSIQNAIYGTNNAGTDATISDGRIGIYNRAPTATLTLSGTPTNGAHISIVHTAPGITGGTLDANATDVAGTATGAASSTGMTITWQKQYASTPHAIVSAHDGVAFTYTATTTALTISHASASGRVFEYMVLQ